MKYLLILLLAFAVLNAETPKKEFPQKPDAKRVESKPFPLHWGEPPAIQTKDIRPLPHGFGMGSSTLANWIKKNIERDKSKPRPPQVTKPKPKPVQPRPEVPEKTKADIETYKEAQQELKKALNEKIKALGKGASKGEVHKVAEEFKKDNREKIEDQRVLGRRINEAMKELRPERPKRPEPSPEVKARVEAVRLASKGLDEARKNLKDDLKGKSKEESVELIKVFRDSQKEKHSELKAAQKELAKLVRERVQTKERRE